MKYKNLHLVGTSHIAKESLEEVEQVIEKNHPDIVAIELDRQRLHALMSKKKRKIKLRDIRRIGFKGYMFSLLGAWAEKKLGESVGVSPGSEMIKSVKLAKKHKARLALIDQDITITLKRLSKAITWKEKWNFLVDIFNAVILRKKDPELNFDLSRVPSKQVIKKMTSKVKKRYPHIYRVLVDERNEVMARNLHTLIRANEDKTIVAVIGAGHEEEMLSLIKAHEKNTVSFGFSTNEGKNI